MYRAKLKEYEFEVEVKNNKLMVNQQLLPLQVLKRSDGGYDINIAEKKFVADIVKLDRELKILVIRIQNKKFSIQIKEPIDLLIDKLGIQTQFAKKINSLKAPMPGLVSKILVSEGAVVKPGEPLLILEAMKMENIFKAADHVTIKAIKIQEKQAVEKGEELISFE